MSNQRKKVTRLLAPTAKLTLEVEGGHKLELDLAWNMRAVITIENRLRAQGINVNIAQRPKEFWGGLSAAGIAAGVWACSEQCHPEYADEDGYGTILSFITPENTPTAIKGLMDAFAESLSKDAREAMRRAAEGTGDVNLDPTPAPDQK